MNRETTFFLMVFLGLFGGAGAYGAWSACGFTAEHRTQPALAWCWSTSPEQTIDGYMYPSDSAVPCKLLKREANI